MLLVEPPPFLPQFYSRQPSLHPQVHEGAHHSTPNHFYLEACLQRNKNILNVSLYLWANVIHQILMIHIHKALFSLWFQSGISKSESLGVGQVQVDLQPSSATQVEVRILVTLC